MTPPDKNEGFVPITPNPFIAGNPIRDREKFFGREEDFRVARQWLVTEREGVVLLFVGDRRSGKTSILFQIDNGRLGEEFLPILIDMMGLIGEMNDREFFAYLAERTCERVGDERIVMDYYDFSLGNPTLVFDRLLEDIRQVRPDQRLIFLFDETEILLNKVLDGELSGAIFVYMASILEKRRISFFFTGSMGIGERQDESWQVLICKGWRRKISFLEPADARRLITRPVEGRVFYEEGVVDAIYHLTYGHPFYTQVVCSVMVDHLNTVQKNVLTRSDLEEIIHTVLDDPPENMMYSWAGLTRQEQLTLSLLSEQGNGEPSFVQAEQLSERIEENGYPVDMSAELLHKQMENLYQQDVLDRTDEHAYGFRMDLFRRWIRRSRSIWRLMEEEQPRTSRIPLLWGLLGVSVLVLAVVIGMWMRRPSEKSMEGEPGGFIPTTGGLLVSSKPQGAEIILDGNRYAKRTPAPIQGLTPGVHALEVHLDGYRIWKDSVEVSVGPMSDKECILERLRGTLSVHSDPPAAQVAVKGEVVDTVVTTPLDALELPTGTYRVTVRKPGYMEEERVVMVTEDMDTSLPITLDARIGGVHIRSDPPGATVFLDGEARSGSTPILLDRLEPREYRLGVWLEDYARRDTTVSIQPLRTDTISFSLRLLPATLTLYSSPDGAAIYIDGADSIAGYTPKTLTLSPERHRIRLALDGHEQSLLEEGFLPGKGSIRSIELKPFYGSIRITGLRPRTIVVDDTQEYAIPPGDIRLPVGTHRIEDRQAGADTTIYVPKDSTVIVRLR